MVLLTLSFLFLIEKFIHNFFFMMKSAGASGCLLSYYDGLISFSILTIGRGVFAAEDIQTGVMWKMTPTSMKSMLAGRK